MNQAPSRFLPLRPSQLLGWAIAAFAVVVPAGPAGAAEERPLAGRIPADSVALLRIPDVSTSLEELRALPLGKIFAEEEIREFLSGPLSQIRRQWREASEEAFNREGLDLDSLLSTRWRAVELAVTRLRAGDSGVEFGVASRLDAGEGWPKVGEFLGKFLEFARKNPDDVRVEDKSAGDRKWWAMRPPAGEGVEGILFWSAEGPDVHVAIASVGSGLADDLFARVAEGKGAPSLAEDADFAACAERCGASSDVFGFLRVPAVVEFLCAGVEVARRSGAPLPSMLTRESVSSVAGALGIAGIRAAAASSTAKGDHWENDVFLLAPAPRAGLLALGEGKADRELLARVPEEAVSFSTGALALGSLWDAAMGAIRGAGGDAARPVEAAIAAFEASKGIQIRRDLFEAVGDRFVSYSLPSPSLVTPGESATLVPLRDAQAFERAASALAELAAEKLPFLEMKAREVQGTTVRSFTIRQEGLPMPQGMPFNPLVLISPSFAVKGGFLLFSTNARGLQKALGRIDSAPGPAGEAGGPVGAARIEGYRRFADLVPEQARSVGYSDPRPTVETVYGIVTSFLPLLGSMGELPVDLSALPSAEAITQHLFGAVSYRTADAQGIQSRSFAPVGADGAALAAGGIVGGVAAFAMRAQPQPPTPAAARAGSALLAGLETVELEHVRFLTDATGEAARQWGAIAEGVYGQLQGLFRADPTHLPLLVYGYATNTRYNRFASDFGDDHSAVYGAYVASREASQPAVATLESGDWGPLHIAHGVGHLFVRGVAGRERAGSIPAWFEEGIASYVERFQDPARRAWSIESLARRGGPGPFAGFASGFRIAADDPEGSQKRMLQAGLLVAYYVHGADAADMDVFGEALRAIREGSAEEVRQAVATLVRDEPGLERKLRDFASEAAQAR